jgi:hypothetical protein
MHGSVRYEFVGLVSQRASTIKLGDPNEILITEAEVVTVLPRATVIG